MAQGSTAFVGPLPEIYDTHLVPLIFEPYAVDVTARLASRSAARVLEIAAGTGVVTRAMAAALPEFVSIVATDLNQPMLDRAAARGTARPVTWRQADALQLPFGDGTFDAVVCQFGVMFFRDKAAAHAEARRVLGSGGCYLFSVWDQIHENEFADTVATAVRAVFPDDPPRFLERTPYGYHDLETIKRDLAAGGFDASPSIVTLPARSRASSAAQAAVAYCQGTPLRNEIEARNASRMSEITGAAAEAIASRFGRAGVEGKIQAHVITITT